MEGLKKFTMRPLIEHRDETHVNENTPFETRADFTNYSDTLATLLQNEEKFKCGDKELQWLPRLRHGMAVLVHMPDNKHQKWCIDWFDLAEQCADGKGFLFVCVNDSYRAHNHGIYPLNPNTAIVPIFGRELHPAYKKWYEQTCKDIEEALKQIKQYK